MAKSKMINLTESKVVFNPDNHTYFLGEVELSGITGMLSRQIFKDKYDGVPIDTLNKAAERGTDIHNQVEFYEESGLVRDTSEVKSYLKIKADNNLNYERNEYLISDNEHFASSIDLVFRENDTEFTLADIKTTYKLDTDYVRWQLSVYAYLFEMQNKGAKAVRLAAIWLRGEDSLFKEVERIPDDVIRDLLDCDANGRQFVNPYAALTTMPEKYLMMVEEIKRINEQADFWEKMKKQLKEGILREMEAAGAVSWKCDAFTFTRKAPYTKSAFDTKRFEGDHPELYKAYQKESQVAGSLLIKINK